MVLRDIILSRPFVNDDANNKVVFLGVIDELLTTYLTLNAMHIRHMKGAEEEAHRALQTQHYGPPPPTPTQHYNNMLKLIAATYRVRPLSLSLSSVVTRARTAPICKKSFGRRTKTRAPIASSSLWLARICPSGSSSPSWTWSLRLRLGAHRMKKKKFYV